MASNDDFFDMRDHPDPAYQNYAFALMSAQATADRRHKMMKRKSDEGPHERCDETKKCKKDEKSNDDSDKKDQFTRDFEAVISSLNDLTIHDAEFSDFRKRLHALPQELYDVSWASTFTVPTKTTINIDRDLRPSSVMQVSSSTREPLLKPYYLENTFTSPTPSKPNFFMLYQWHDSVPEKFKWDVNEPWKGPSYGLTRALLDLFRRPVSQFARERLQHYRGLRITG